MLLNIDTYSDILIFIMQFHANMHHHHQLHWVLYEERLGDKNVTLNLNCCKHTINSFTFNGDVDVK